ncbi:MAG: DNA mismatch repair endonuclease MutL [Deltaproteobacteria bacterium]|nr:DNA mismatch repair endonuclease MutL [Deltaproteobacteria bacterium]
MTIAVLPDNLIDRIAAGEVVERPASVVKELVDNALDAGATEISVLVDGNGTSLIRVNDDGEGVPFDEVTLAFERHSTSKIRSEADLAEIATMGFRGEALPSIASVAVVEMVSRPASQESGCRYRVENGRKGSPVAAGCPVGTTVEVRDLFYHVPARLKFMKSPRTEIKYVSEVVNRVALAHPSVHFRLHHGGKRLADYAATTRLEDRVRQVFGDAGSELVPFSLTREHLRCTGFASRAPQSFGNTRYMVTFVNGRFVRDKLLTHAMLKAYDTLLMKGRYPATLLYLELPHGYVDVNVHPAKTEVRFRRQSELYETVLSAVRGGLRAAAGDGPLSPPPGASDPPGPYPQAPGHQAVREPGPAYDAASLSPGLPLEPRRPALAGGPGFQPREAREQGEEGRFSSLTVVGQVLGCYILCHGAPGMVLIDQHAAHERVAYQRMHEDLERGRIERQELLMPQLLELPVTEALVLEEQLGALERAGFTLEAFGRNTFSLRAVPALLAEGDYRDAVRAMISELAETGGTAELHQGFQERLMSIACHGVIRANRALEMEEMKALLNELDETEFATQCPHGRPVMVQFSRGQLERMFRRA